MSAVWLQILSAGAQSEGSRALPVSHDVGPAQFAVMNDGLIDEGFWRDRRVLVTGHTGFKGGWLSLWLQAMGAQVFGLSSGVPTRPSIYELARVGERMAAEIDADIREMKPIVEASRQLQPEIVIHMAAQPLVRHSFAHPRETFETNVMGTVNVLESARSAPSTRVVVIVTSDKCYENRGWEWGYREDEPMGGHDPYSGSKGAAEIVVAAYRRSFFSVPDGPAVASVRAGNVIGGGDWGGERLIPDLVRAALAGETLHVRHPTAVRPWQHVASPLSGYLLLAQSLWTQPGLAGGWNFGPEEDDAQAVSWIVERMREKWGGKPHWHADPGPHPHEASYLKLDSSRARLRLGWRPLVGLDAALASIVDWYEAWRAGADMQAVTLRQIEELTGARR
ncbi:MAG: CDP-glucose 4,6-dehydratase [Solirubrobacteraceae bacterium]